MNFLVPVYQIPLLLALFKLASGGPKGHGASSSGTKENDEKVCQIEGMRPGTFLVTNKYGQEQTFQLQLKHISEGGFGIVYHAHPENWHEFVKNAAVDLPDGQRHCVALKVAMATKDENEQLTESPQEVSLGNEIKILREFAKLENGEQCRHLVKLYYEGKVKSEGQINPDKAYAMELGEMSLSEHLYGKDNEGKLTNVLIEKMAKDIALAMRDFHRVAMHLDLKPGNMVYFKDPNGANENAKILKAIDFGSSQILDRNEGPENRANFSKNDVILPVGTPHYTSPELKHDYNIELTPKSDIWSIGIMIYEAILFNSETDLKFFHDLMGKEIPRAEIILELNNLYKFKKEDWITERIITMRTNEKVRHGTPISKRHKTRTHVEYAAYVYLVYKVRSQHMFLYELINVCLELDPKDRPSAAGILVYLERKCTLRPINELNPIRILLDDGTVEEQNPIQISVDLGTVQTIKNHFINRKNKLSNLHKRVLTKIPYTTDKAKRMLQKAEIRRITGFSKWNGNLRAHIINKVNPHPPPHDPPVIWCDTQTSELPKFKDAENPISETVNKKKESPRFMKRSKTF